MDAEAVLPDSDACRSHKLKCDQEEPCHHCTRRKVACVYSRDPRANAASQSHQDRTADGNGSDRSPSKHTLSNSPTSASKERRDTYVHHLERLLDATVLKCEALEVELGHANRLGYRAPPTRPRSGDSLPETSSQHVDGRTGVRLWFPERFIPDLQPSDQAGNAEKTTPALQQLTSNMDVASSKLLKEPAEATLQRSPLLDLLWPGWPRDLPDPDVVFSLSELCEVVRETCVGARSLCPVATPPTQSLPSRHSVRSSTSQPFCRV